MLAFTLTAFSAVFSVVDPLGAVPVYLAMTGADSREHKRRTALRAALGMLVTLCLFAAAGTAILTFFGISLGALRIAGGVLLLLLSIDLLRARPSRQKLTPEEEQEGADKADISIFPLAIPLLSGPGAVATVVVLMTRAHGALERLAVFLAIALTAVLTFVILIGATFAEKQLGRTGLNILHRVMGLLLAAIAVQFMIDGARDVLPWILQASR
jgi:multiple antibiotic resistance protein